MSPGLTRRELAAVAAAGALPLLLDTRSALARATSDVAVLRSAVDLEQKAVLTYASAARALDSRTARLAEHFREQEQKHADGLTTALRDRGGAPPAKPRSPHAVPGLARALGRDRATILRFAIGLEQVAVSAYYAAQAKLRDPILLSAGASIMANEGQHLAMLRQTLGGEPVPHALERGER